MPSPQGGRCEVRALLFVAAWKDRQAARKDGKQKPEMTAWKDRQRGAGSLAGQIPACTVQFRSPGKM